jgi:prepilin-type N-terminal cleavage/methylation domain-containing protein
MSIRSQRGDTLIEVLLSITVLAVLITISSAVMTRGLGTALNSLDKTNVDSIINGQVAILRNIQARAAAGTDVVSWDKVKKLTADNNTSGNGLYYADTASSSGHLGTANTDGCTPGIAGYENALFYFDPSSDDVFTPVKYFPSGLQSNSLTRQGTVPKPGDGIWIEGYKDFSSNNADVYTFYVKACWASVYSTSVNVPNQAKTSVRLYEPY